MAQSSAHRSSTTDDARRPRRPTSTLAQFFSTLGDRYGLVLSLLVVTYVLASALPPRGWVAPILAAIQGVTVMVALAASGTSDRHRRLAAGAATLAVVIAGCAAAAGGRADGVPALISAVLLGVALLAIIRRLVSHERITSQTLLGAMCCYVIFGLIYTFVYAAVSRLETEPFLAPATSHSLSDFLFFSFTTLTTTGYGNLVPVTGLGRALSMLEALTGQLYLVTVVARLVALWMPRVRRTPSPRPGDDESPGGG
jgi:ABC-type thiamin/hydroxymethylpyrimidine transport system permease subunit